jgi:small subunit ribosomal protein S1
MAGTGNQQPAPSARPVPPGAPRPLPATAPRKPPQVLMLKKDEPLPATTDPTAALQAPGAAQAPAPAPVAAPGRPVPASSPKRSDEDLFDMGGLEGLTMADLLGPDSGRQGRGQAAPKATAATPAAAAAPEPTAAVTAAPPAEEATRPESPTQLQPQFMRRQFGRTRRTHGRRALTPIKSHRSTATTRRRH